MPNKDESLGKWRYAVVDGRLVAVTDDDTERTLVGWDADDLDDDDARLHPKDRELLESLQRSLHRLLLRLLREQQEAGPVWREIVAYWHSPEGRAERESWREELPHEMT